MAKVKTAYVCASCGHSSNNWMGICPTCGQGGTFNEVNVGAEKTGKGARKNWAGASSTQVQSLGKIDSNATALRMMTNLGELDRVLGGGIVVGGVVLLGGDPGIGKSTILLQAADSIAKTTPDSALYVTGEESLAQVAARANRLDLEPKNIQALAETQIEIILDHIEQMRPKLVIIDSIQTLFTENIPGAPGSVSQVRECAAHLVRQAKQLGVAVFLVGHVTKDGTIAGPRVLEHLVDTVLSFEGDPQSPYRLIRSIKNRFGAANELGAFEMTEGGLISVNDPSALFLSQDRRAAQGACVCVLQEGPRALLIEIQALMDYIMGNNPTRLGVGVDSNRLSMILAVLHKHAQVDIGAYDAYVNAVGGIKATDPGADLPILLAILSSLRGKSLPADLCCFGELGLTGEIRPVQHGEDRFREAVRIGFKRILLPLRNMPKKLPPNVEVVGVRHMSEVLQQIRHWEH